MRQLEHPAMIVAAIALFVALGGGMAVAAGGLISGSKITNHSIPENKLTASAVSALTGQTGAAGPAGPKGASGPAGPPGPSHSYSAFNIGPVVIGPNTATVDTLTVPAGSYIVMANTTVYNTSVSDDVVCYVFSPNKTQLDIAYASFSTVAGSLSGQNTVSLLAPMTTTGGNVTLQCLAGDANTNAIYSRIAATKVGGLTGNAGHFHGARKANVSG